MWRRILRCGLRRAFAGTLGEGADAAVSSAWVHVASPVETRRSGACGLPRSQRRSRVKEKKTRRGKKAQEEESCEGLWSLIRREMEAAVPWRRTAKRRARLLPQRDECGCGGV